MTQVAHHFPALEIRETAKPKKQPSRGYDLKGERSKRAAKKYDHDHMLRDRLSGMTWLQLAEKHGIAPQATKRNRAVAAHNILSNSNAMHRMTPEQAKQLESIDGRIA